MELHRMTPVDVGFEEALDKDTSLPEYPHRMLLLRAELVEIYFQHKYRLHIREVSSKVYILHI
jgi:protein TIF31